MMGNDFRLELVNSYLDLGKVLTDEPTNRLDDQLKTLVILRRTTFTAILMVRLVELKPEDIKFVCRKSHVVAIFLLLDKKTIKL